MHDSGYASPRRQSDQAQPETFVGFSLLPHYAIHSSDDLTWITRYSLTWEFLREVPPRRTDFRRTFSWETTVPERQATVRLLPIPQPGTGVVRRTCKRPRCCNEIDPPAGRSRPREFCSDACRNLYHRERAQARNTLLEARRLAAEYKIDETVPEPAPRGLEVSEHTSSLSSLESVRPGHLALSLIAQALESIRVDLQDGTPLDLEGVLARITTAKEQGDRLLRTYGKRDGF